MNAREIYDTTLRQLPAIDRLRLASFILEDLAASSGAGVDLRDDWSDEDIADLTKFSIQNAGRSVPAEDSDA